MTTQFRKNPFGGKRVEAKYDEKSAFSDCSVYPPVTPSLIFIKKELLHTICL